VLGRPCSSAAALARVNLQYSMQVIAGARASFLEGVNWAYAAGAVSIVFGAVLVAALLPTKQREIDLLAEYRSEDALPVA
jgi:DHA2 family multidrug resistance protein-like MFS transporter